MVDGLPIKQWNNGESKGAKKVKRLVASACEVASDNNNKNGKLGFGLGPLSRTRHSSGCWGLGSSVLLHSD